jgi:hypothetical protein
LEAIQKGEDGYQLGLPLILVYVFKYVSLLAKILPRCHHEDCEVFAHIFLFLLIDVDVVSLFCAEIYHSSELLENATRNASKYKVTIGGSLLQIEMLPNVFPLFWFSVTV